MTIILRNPGEQGANRRLYSHFRHVNDPIEHDPYTFCVISLDTASCGRHTTLDGPSPTAEESRDTMRTANCVKALALLVVVPSASLAAQEPGDIVRVSGELKAEFIRSDSTGLYLSTGFVPYADITSLELKVGTQSRWREGMLIGGLAGAGIGAVLVLSNCESSGAISCGGVAILGAGLLALPGALVGTLIGATQQTDRFTPILLPTTRAGAVQTPDGRFGLELGVRWRF